MNFTRGQDPKESMGIGRDAILKEIGGIIIDKEDPNSKFSSETAVVILIEKGKYKLLRNRFGLVEEEGDEKDLINLLLKLQEQFRKWDPDNPFFIHAQKVFARTIGIDLVPVIPMSAPSGNSLYLDYKYKKQNIIQKFFKKNFLAKPSKKPSI
jgi:hypothetical protein